MLTKRQRETLNFIVERTSATGVCPSYDEMAGALHLKTRGNLTRILDCLVERGHITRVKHKHRSVQVLRPSVGVAPPHVCTSPSRVPLTHPGPEAQFFIVEKPDGGNAYLVEMPRP